MEYMIGYDAVKHKYHKLILIQNIQYIDLKHIVCYIITFSDMLVCNNPLL